jgi:predicted metal-dependent hydrolase
MSEDNAIMPVNSSLAVLRSDQKIEDHESSVELVSGEVVVKKRRDILEQAYEKLFDKACKHSTKVKFSSQFKAYNANIRLFAGKMELRLCRKWKQVDKEIVIGLVQSLLLRVLKKKKDSINVDLYNNFVKNLHIAIPKDNIDEELLESFNRVNEEYLFGAIECPNLVWGQHSVRKLGSYEYKSDVISISSALRDVDQEMLDYVMYHEMLHKKFKFSSTGSRTVYHSKEFKAEEAKFKDAAVLERKLGRLRPRSVRKIGKRKGLLRLFDWI